MSADRERPLHVLGDLARAEIRGDVAAVDHDRGRARALSAFARRPTRARRAAPWLVAAAIACAIAAMLIARPRAPLGYTVEGAIASQGYVHARPSGAGAVLRFSDGSEIALAPGAGARVAEVGPRGARVEVESGAAKVHVAHLPGARWSIEAGPFSIAVLGTRFDVAWSPATQALDVRLHEGAIQVRGPLAPGGIDLRAGQHLVARGSEGEMHIDEGAPRTSQAPSVEPVAPPSPPPPSPTASSPPPPVDAPARPALRVPRWPERVAAGDFRGVLAEADARGIDRATRLAPLADLVALADAARYGRRPDAARRALIAERDRFPRTAEARAAAFLLGRLADDAGGSPGDAIRWYDAYLAEAPAGAFAAEAMGRKMIALRRAKDPAARAIAVEYLRLHPAGPHAAAAREIAAP